jgi:hypothetical protein
MPRPRKSAVSSQEEALIEQAKQDIRTRCDAAGLKCEEWTSIFEPKGNGLKIGMRRGRDFSWVFLDPKNVAKFASVVFEDWVFLSGYDAICSYADNLIEAFVRPAVVSGTNPFMLDKLFGQHAIVIDPPASGFPRIELSAPSNVFKAITRHSWGKITLKLSECEVNTNDQARALLKKVADAVFFQIDLLADVPLSLQREHRGSPLARRARPPISLTTDLKYPAREYDDAPISLYWYARSARGMPLLQFLAFYQVIEFYFPAYSHAEAQRRLKAMLKDPLFRPDRDADIGKLLASIRVGRTGVYGDERSQMRATLTECVDPRSLREFLESDDNRKEFYVGKAKGSAYHKVPLANPAADLRGDVAERIYDIRCKIVHTKAEAGEAEVDLLLPFSKEAEQLSFDIELAQYLAQSVLIAASLPFQAKG